MTAITTVTSETIQEREAAIAKAHRFADANGGRTRFDARNLEAELRGVLRDYGLTRTAVGKFLADGNAAGFRVAKRSGKVCTHAQFADLVRSVDAAAYWVAVDTIIDRYNAACFAASLSDSEMLAAVYTRTLDFIDHQIGCATHDANLSRIAGDVTNATTARNRIKTMRAEFDRVTRERDNFFSTTN